jgi:histidine triad (HIT) family protein
MEDRNVSDCIFCSIIQGLAAASTVYDDDIAMAFMDIQPVNPGHVLVVPKRHAAFLSELDEATTAHLFVIAKRLAAAVRHSSLRCEGINLFLADGEAAFQDVFHTHVHVIPRFHGDGFGLRFGPDYGQLPGRKDLDDAAARIRAAGGC